MEDFFNPSAKQEVPAEEKSVKSRRGLGSARGTTKLKFSHELAKPNRLFLAHLENVEVSMSKPNEDNSVKPSFNGLEVPRISFTFASNDDELSRRCYVYLTFFAPESNAKTIPTGDEAWKVNSILDWMKHILDVYVLNGREMNNEEINYLSLDYDDFDEKGEYSPVEPEVVLACWTKLFNNFADYLNRGNNGKPFYKQENGKDIPVWIKLLRYTKSNNRGWMQLANGELAFPTFVGEGCIERFKQNVMPSIRVNTVKESIVPMNIEKPKAPNMPIMQMGGIAIGNSAVSSPLQNDNLGGFQGSVEEDLPF